MALNNVNLSFKFADGRVSVVPFDLNVAGIKSTIEGSSGFDQTIDYTINMNVPTALIGSQATSVVSGLLSQANKAAGTNLSMGKEVKVSAKMTGTVTDPKIETGIKDMASNTVTDIKTEIKQQFDDKKKELEDQAKAEADRLKKEAEDKVKSEADKLKKEAETKAKAEADRLKKEAEEKAKKEAENQLKNLFGKPKK
ncbi:MAG: hypothetical protein IPP71_12060 [Bacteroidetes bacterium]|nr:hypothetical protein [Bacteroidota bacterium]